ncbi:patatin-like phospholipase domain-containing protein 4 isoform X2 [Spea bombifrons]|uniref:patatin-like phospholipase domain-containing protein 4 isoform X2 n=1 Tax=Spea bombifrons TaxID=233779 RepID=UPI002349D5F9|nr:patatin-like phospholipase domain-containing protein 4 isoform X2 [Spea bombifrons]
MAEEKRMSHVNLSFSACGFLGIYHLGAASALLRHGQRLLRTVKIFAGASAGSLAAAVLLTAPDKLKESKDFLYSFSEDVRKQTLGAVTPRYNFMEYLRGGIESILPFKAHEIAESRLCISITNTKSRENLLVSKFASREELIKVLLASCFIPVYAGIKAVEYKGEKWFDGGFTNSLPILPIGRTITVSPFCGRHNICPEDIGHVDLYLKVAKQDILLSTANLERLNQALFPPSQEQMESIFQDGFEDAVKFLQTENWFE